MKWTLVVKVSVASVAVANSREESTTGHRERSGLVADLTEASAFPPFQGALELGCDPKLFLME